MTRNVAAKMPFCLLCIDANTNKTQDQTSRSCIINHWLGPRPSISATTNATGNGIQILFYNKTFDIIISNKCNRHAIYHSNIVTHLKLWLAKHFFFSSLSTNASILYEDSQSVAISINTAWDTYCFNIGSIRFSPIHRLSFRHNRHQINDVWYRKHVK